MKREYFTSVGESVYSQRLDNGLAVFVIPKKGYHKAMAHFSVNYGGSDMRFKVNGAEHSTPAGVAHFLEHKLFDTKNGNALTLLAQNGASPNAYTSNGITAYHFECTDKFFENLEILLSFVTEPYFTAESVAKEQGIIGQEIGMYDDDPDHACYMALTKSLFRVNPVRTDIAGTAESIAEITPETLYLCHGSFYVPSNMALTVVGDVEPEKVAEFASRLTPHSSAAAPEREYGAESIKTPTETVTKRKMAVSIPKFAVGSSIILPESAAERQKCRVLAELVGMLIFGDSSKLYSGLYAQGTINRSFGFGADFFPGGGQLLCAGESAEPEKVFDKAREAAEKLAQNGPDTKDFARVKNAMTGEYIFALNSFDDICYNQASEYFSGARSMDRPSILAGLEPGDAADFARANLRAEDMAMSVIAPAE